jgi:2-polyprenyl-3-methyl-5-hydroxy-6-metoxy-1,4-benzoquinol methylase
MLRLEACPACGSETFRLSYKGRTGRVKEDQVWTVDRCGECGHEFINPQPSWEELGRYYTPEYSAYDPSTAAEGDDDEVVARAREAGEFRHIRIAPGVRLLDVGCGGGYFLKIAQRLGAEAEGVEPSGYAAGVSRRTGLPIYCGTLEEYAAQNPSARFDVVTANHVLAHVPQPAETLRVMGGLLAPGGYVWISVPNAACSACRVLRDQWHSTDLPFHIMQFNSTSLRRAGERAGLRLQSLTTYSLPRATAESIRSVLRRRYAVPARLTARIGLIDSFIAPRVSRRLDAGGRGEALIATFVRED